MAASKSTNTYNRQGWEDAEFPVLCQTCLGDNPYIRMTKEKFSKECKICERPFSVFRWCPGARMRFKKTEICQTCSKLKNICQTCLLDLEYGLPTQVRDYALKVKDEIPRSDVNKEYYMQNIERELANTDGTVAAGALGKAQAPSDLLLKLARTAPYYKRNRPHICSFWVKGECRRGEECPYRHEKPTDPDDPLADQNIKDRYFGQCDPVADKLLKRAAAMPSLDPPEDKSITTLYIGQLTDKIGETDIRDFFYQFGEIRTITVVPKQQCAFVQFSTRTAAEQAVQKSFGKLIIKGRRLNLRWGRSQGKLLEGGKRGDEGITVPLIAVPGLPSALPPPPMEQSSIGLLSASQQQRSTDYFNLDSAPPGTLPLALPPIFPGFIPPPPGVVYPPAGIPPALMSLGPFAGKPIPPMPPTVNDTRAQIHYPSQDPHRMGAIAQQTDTNPTE